MLFKSHIKLSVLKRLNQESQSGYDLITTLGEFGGKKPSAGYIYPLLKELEQKGFVSQKNDGRRKLYHISIKGKEFLSSMQKNHDEMLDKMIKTMEPIAEKNEMADYLAFRLRLQKNKSHLIRDIDLMDKFHKALYGIYERNDPKLRKELRKIIFNSTKTLERINKKQDNKNDRKKRMQKR